MHASEDRLLAYLDDEVPEGERQVVARHLEACRPCADALEALREISRRLSVGLQRLDRPAPALHPAAIRRRAGVLDVARGRDDDARPAAGPASPDEEAPSGRRSGRPAGADRPRRSLLAAAVLLLAFTGVAAAIPGSPVRAWLTDSARAIAGLFGGGEEPAPTVVDQEAVEAATRLPSGVAVEPYGGSVRISLRSPSPDAVVRVRVVDDARATVLASDARYRTGPGRIEVLGAGPGDLRIEIPRSVASAIVEVDGRPVVEKVGTDLRLLTPADTSGSEIFFRPGG